MELTFEKQDNFYVSEFQLTSDANLHIEKSTGKLQLFQRTIGAGDYAEVKDFDTSDYDSDKIIDFDFQALVYPKWIKIKSAVKPLVATITTDGEVNEVVYQAKDIEITSNGTTKVTADTGYTALGSVNVKVNVPTEGGSESGSTMEYLDVSEVDIYVKQILLSFSLYVKVPQDIIIDTSEGGNQTTATIFAGISTSAIVSTQMGELGMSSALINTVLSGITALGFDFSSKLVSQGQTVTIYEYFIMSGSKEIIDAIPRITKEEFYHIPKDEVWPLNTQEDYKVAWDKLYPLVEKYGADYINENGLSLAPWYKSLTIGDEVVTELSWYSLGKDGDSERELIKFTKYTGIEKYTYTDGTIEYQSYNPPM